jgi:cell division protein FtsB
MYTQKKSIDNTHIVRERDRQRNRELAAVLSLGVPIGLFLLLFTWQNLEVIRLGREATRLQKNLKDVEAEHKALQAELDRLTSFDAVEEKASALGFATTDSKAVVSIEGAGGRAQGAGVPASPGESR